MSLWLLYALGAALLASFNPIIIKRLLRDTDVTVVAWAGQAFALPLLGLIFVTLAWAYWLLRERDLPRRLPGALIMLAGAALIGG